jgi:hypothetical protein
MRVICDCVVLDLLANKNETIKDGRPVLHLAAMNMYDIDYIDYIVEFDVGVLFPS